MPKGTNRPRAAQSPRPRPRSKTSYPFARSAETSPRPCPVRRACSDGASIFPGRIQAVSLWRNRAVCAHAGSVKTGEVGNARAHENIEWMVGAMRILFVATCFYFACVYDPAFCLTLRKTPHVVVFRKIDNNIEVVFGVIIRSASTRRSPAHAAGRQQGR